MAQQVHKHAGRNAHQHAHGDKVMPQKPAIGSQPPCGGGGAGVALGASCGTQSGRSGIGMSGIQSLGMMPPELGVGAGVPCGVCVPFAGARPHLQGSP